MNYGRARLILAHDLGTTGNKATLYDPDGVLLGSAFSGYDTIYPHEAWAEQDPGEWWTAVKHSTRELLAKGKVAPSDIAVIAFSGQMMGCVPVDRDGNPVRTAIIWADQRATKQAARLASEIGEERVYRLTGHRASPSYSAAKMMWFKDHQPELFARTATFLQAKDFIVRLMTGRTVTDYSDASSTNLFDLTRHEWSPELVEASGIPSELLPEPVRSATVVGDLLPGPAAELGLRAGTPVVIGGGDGACAATGAGVVREGDCYNYLGSSSWIATAASEPWFDPEMRTFTWAHLDPDLYTPCGTMHTAGASYDWLRRVICPPEEAVAGQLALSPYELMNMAAERVPVGSEGLLFLPYLLGERSPHWNPTARGVFVGLSVRHERRHLIRAVAEGVSLNLLTILEALAQQVEIRAVRVIGGGARGKLWCQLLADVYGRPVHRLRWLEEATSLGAAVAGGVGVGLFPDFGVARDLAQVADVIEPDAERTARYRQVYRVFRQAYEALVPVFRDLATMAEQGSG
ncbi:MAG: xylulokinase [Betaproteobacteria bacterium]